MMIRLASPWFLLFLMILPLFLWHFYKTKPANIYFSDLRLFEGIHFKNRRKWVLLILRCVAWGLLVLAMSRPQYISRTEEALTQGIDIVLVIDTSTSMLALDFKPLNRLDAAKEVVADFIRGRKQDRIGSVVFAALAYTQCPLTMDYRVLLNLLNETKIGMIDDGTAIGMALALAVKRLQKSNAKSKVVVLLSDGGNTAGEIDPKTAAELAKSFGIKVYAVGVGKEGEVLYPRRDMFGRLRYVPVQSTLNEKALREIAQITGGRYFRAENQERLEDIYEDIDALEKTEIKIKEYFQYKEYFVYCLWGALFLLFLEFLLKGFIWRKLP
jgi:Ca-activated chloride channel family protein